MRHVESIMMYIHPPLAILGYIFIFLSLIFMLLEHRHNATIKFTRVALYLAWFFNLAGLVTGIIWAGIAWGAYWSWDPKETVTLLIFISVCMSVLLYEKRRKISLLLLLCCLLFIVANLLITFGSFSLHGYGL